MNTERQELTLQEQAQVDGAVKGIIFSEVREREPELYKGLEGMFVRKDMKHVQDTQALLHKEILEN